MRELKDYFCTETQTQELIKLGLSEKHGISAEQYETAEFGYSGFLRSQALDFFRDLGWSGYARDYTAERHVFCINRVTEDKEIKRLKHIQVVIPPNVKNSHEDKKVVESNLIDKLIELEKEARNGN